MKKIKIDTTTRSFSELVLELVASADEVASLAKDSEFDIEALSEFAIYVEKLSPILDTLREDNKLLIMDTPSIRSAIKSLEAELQRARNCIIKQNVVSSKDDRHFNFIQQLTHDLGRSLGLLLFASIEVSLELKDKVGILHKEMMNAKFDHQSYNCYSSSRSTGEIVEEIIINDDYHGRVCCDNNKEEIDEREDVALQLKYGNDDEFKNSLLGLKILIKDKVIDCEWINDEGIIPILFNRLGSTKCIDRLSIIKVLRSIIALDNPQTKENMAEVTSLTTLVKSLARDEVERREAVGLLMDLAQLSSVRRRIGRIQGCIIMLVAILNGNDPVSSNDAGELLAALSCNTQNALLMAEAGYFHPLIQHLKDGSEMSKILMATSLSRMVLTEKTRALLGEDGAIQPLVIMFKTGKLEAKLSALNALQNLSLSIKNIPYIVSSGILPPLLQLLFSVTSSLMSLREPASAILATISSSESILEHRDLPNQLLSLLNLTSPKIKCNILVAINSILSQPGACEVRNKAIQNGAIQLLLPLINETDTKIRMAALNFLYTISNNVSIEETYLPNIVSIISSTSSEAEKAAAVGLLSNIPPSDKKATDILKRLNLLPMLVSLIGSLSSSNSTTTSRWLEESAAGVFIRFTQPSDKKLQLYAAEMGIIPVLVRLLSDGSIKAKSRAATSLAQLSQNSLSSKGSRISRWGYCVPTRTTDGFCEIHSGYCSIKGNFCLVKAGAITPLIQVLEGDKREADEEVLVMIATLLQDEIQEDGSNFIARLSGGMEAIIKVLEVGSLKAKETALWILERIFQVEDYRLKYGASAQVVLIDLAHEEEPSLRSLVAKILAQLELLQEQSSYF